RAAVGGAADRGGVAADVQLAGGAIPDRAGQARYLLHGRLAGSGRPHRRGAQGVRGQGVVLAVLVAGTDVGRAAAVCADRGRWGGERCGGGGGGGVGGGRHACSSFSDADRCTMDKECPIWLPAGQVLIVGSHSLPVDTHRSLPFDVAATLDQTPPPIDPVGTENQVCSTWPVCWSSSTTLPRASGRSQPDARPTYTWPPTTVGEAQL